MTDAAPTPGHSFQRLVRILRRLRAPDGCPWDRQQTFQSLRRYVLEEAYEVVQAIDDDDLAGLREELGDLMLQIVFLSQLATEKALFSVDDVVDAVCDKLVRRHPHVFGAGQVGSAEEVLRRWEGLKHRERGGGSVLDDVPAALPALARAEKLGRRAAQRGFDWEGPEAVLVKVREELAELEELVPGRDPKGLEEELGDLLFAVSNLTRHLDLSPEVALRRANDKFERRFRALEPRLAGGESLSPAALDELWEEVKATEAEGSGSAPEKMD